MVIHETAKMDMHSWHQR